MAGTSPAGDTSPFSKWGYLGIGLAVGVLLGVALIVAFVPPSSSPSPPPRVTPTPGLPVVNSFSSAIGANAVETTPAFSVAAGGILLVFVSFVNFEIGGGASSAPADSLGDTYTLVSSTENEVNHTENLYEAVPSAADPALVVSVGFAGGATAMGGAVTAIDVTGANGSALGGFAVEAVQQTAGIGSGAVMGLVVNQTGDLFLLGISGRQIDAPFAPGPNETGLTNGSAIVGPFEDGVAFATFASSERLLAVTLSATLNPVDAPALFCAIGVAVGPLPT